jgi:hypothetical protein
VPDHFDLWLEGRQVATYRRLSLAHDWSLLELEPALAGSIAVCSSRSSLPWTSSDLGSTSTPQH